MPTIEESTMVHVRLECLRQSVKSMSALSSPPDVSNILERAKTFESYVVGNPGSSGDNAAGPGGLSSQPDVKQADTGPGDRGAQSKRKK